MGKVVKTIVGVALTVVGFMTGNVALIVQGAAMTFSSLTEKSPKQKTSASAATEQRLSKRLEPEAFRKIVFGETAGGSDMRYWEVYGTNATNYVEVIALACHQVNAIKSLYFEDDLAFNGTATSASGSYAGTVTRTLKTVGLTGAGVPIGGHGVWTTAASMTGLAYYILTWSYSQDKLPNGIPSRYTSVIEGALVYDPRRDSTRGGSGSHRVDDQSTWEYSPLDSNDVPIGRNNALQMLWYELGWRVNGKLVAGRGVDPADIDFSSFITAANDCESEEWYSDCILSTGDSHGTNESIIASAASGKLLDTGGRFSYVVATDDTAIISADFDDNDIVSEISWTPRDPMSAQFNEVAGTFVDPAALYQPRPFPTVLNTAYQTADGFKRRKSQPLSAVQDSDQAQRLMEIELNRSRYQGVFRATFSWKALRVKNWDCVRISFTKFGWTNKLFRVESQAISPLGGIELTLREEDPSAYIVPEVWPPAPNGDTYKYDPFQTVAVAGLSATATGVSGASNSAIDAMRLAWTAAPGNVQRTEVRYRKTADTEYTTVAPMRPDQNVVIIAPLLATTGYTFEVRHITVNDRQGAWATVTQTTNAVTRAPDGTIRYSDGTLIDALRPGEAGANVTETRVASSITGQTSWATYGTYTPSQVTTPVTTYLFARTQSQVEIATGSARWHRVARVVSPSGRGSARVALAFNGDGAIPSAVVLDVSSDWGVSGSISIVSNGTGSPITQARLSKISGETYLDVYIGAISTSNLTIDVEPIPGTQGVWVVHYQDTPTVGSTLIGVIPLVDDSNNRVTGIMTDGTHTLLSAAGGVRTNGVNAVNSSGFSYDVIHGADRAVLERGANITESRTAAAYTGQTAWGTFSGSTNRVQYLSDAGLLDDLTRVTSRPFTALTARTADNLSYVGGGGVTVETLRPAEGGANVTETRVAASITGQTAWATSALPTARLTNLSDGGAFNDLANVTTRPLTALTGRTADNITYIGGGGPTLEVMRPQEAGANVTESRTAAAITGQTAWATSALPTARLTNLSDSGAFNDLANVTTRPFTALTARTADNLTYVTGGATVESLRPGEAGANVTESRVAASITGQTSWATYSALTPTQVATPVQTYLSNRTQSLVVVGAGGQRWFRVARVVSPARGAARVTLGFDGGAATPSAVVLDVSSDWNVDGGSIAIISNGVGGPITEARLSKGTGEAYLDVRATLSSTNMMIDVEPLPGTSGVWAVNYVDAPTVGANLVGSIPLQDAGGNKVTGVMTNGTYTLISSAGGVNTNGVAAVNASGVSYDVTHGADRAVLERGANVTETRVAASITGQTAWATSALPTARLTNLSDGGAFNDLSNVTTRPLSALTGRTADQLNYVGGGGATVETLRPGEAGANVTETRTAASITGQTTWATYATYTPSQITTPVATYLTNRTQSSVTVATGSERWHRVAKVVSSAARGAGRVTIGFNGGGSTPAAVVLDVSSDWSEGGSVTIVSNGYGAPITDARLSKTGGEAYLDVKIPGISSSAMAIDVEPFPGTLGVWAVDYVDTPTVGTTLVGVIPLRDASNNRVTGVMSNGTHSLVSSAGGFVTNGVAAVNSSGLSFDVIHGADRAVLERGANITETRTASAVTGQTAWATATVPGGLTPTIVGDRTQHLDNSTGVLDNLTSITTRPLSALTGRTADQITYVTGGATVDSLKPAEAAADVTGGHVAASVTGQTDWATDTTRTPAQLAGAIDTSGVALKLTAASGITVGSGVTTTLAGQPYTLQAGDDESVSFPVTYSNPPLIIPAGSDNLIAMTTAGDYYQTAAVDVTTTGFKGQARKKNPGSGGTPTARLDDGSGDASTIANASIHYRHKENSGVSQDGHYLATFQIKTTGKRDAPSEPIYPRSMVVGFYGRQTSGGSWVLLASASYSSAAGLTTATSTKTLDGTNAWTSWTPYSGSDPAGFEYKIEVISGYVANEMCLYDFTSVAWTELVGGSGATDVTALADGRKMTYLVFPLAG